MAPLVTRVRGHSGSSRARPGCDGGPRSSVIGLDTHAAPSASPGLTGEPVPGGDHGPLAAVGTAGGGAGPSQPGPTDQTGRSAPE